MKNCNFTSFVIVVRPPAPAPAMGKSSGQKALQAVLKLTTILIDFYWQRYNGGMPAGRELFKNSIQEPFGVLRLELQAWSQNEISIINRFLS